MGGRGARLGGQAPLFGDTMQVAWRQRLGPQRKPLWLAHACREGTGLPMPHNLGTMTEGTAWQARPSAIRGA